MAYTGHKLNQFLNALATLEDVLLNEKTPIIRDATIQRFEYTVEVFWKLLKQYLFEQEGVDAPTPKSAIREGGVRGLLNDNEVAKALTMIDDRNLTSHLYNEGLADDLYEKIAEYALLMRTIGSRLQ